MNNEYEYSQLLLFSPFKREDDLNPNDRVKCNQLYNEVNSQGISKVDFVKSQILEHLDQVEACRDQIAEIDPENVQDDLDPENAQLEDDCLAESVQDFPNNLHTDFESQVIESLLWFSNFCFM